MPDVHLFMQKGNNKPFNAVLLLGYEENEDMCALTRFWPTCPKGLRLSKWMIKGDCGDNLVVLSKRTMINCGSQCVYLSLSLLIIYVSFLQSRKQSLRSKGTFLFYGSSYLTRVLDAFFTVKYKKHPGYSTDVARSDYHSLKYCF